MNIIFVLIGASLVIAIVFLGAFIYSVRKGQYDDTFSPAHRILFDDKEPKDKQDLKNNNNN